jgi:hypothetical protein
MGPLHTSFIPSSHLCRDSSRPKFNRPIPPISSLSLAMVTVNRQDAQKESPEICRYSNIGEGSKTYQTRQKPTNLAYSPTVGESARLTKSAMTPTVGVTPFQEDSLVHERQHLAVFISIMLRFGYALTRTGVGIFTQTNCVFATTMSTSSRIATKGSLFAEIQPQCWSTSGIHRCAWFQTRISPMNK